MTSKEALDELNIILKTNYETKRYSDIFEEHLIKVIEEDLEVLEILKHRISLKEDTIKGAHFTINEKGLPEIENDAKDYDVAFIEASGFVFKNSDEYKLLKEWLEK